jgi:hypothetical protein
MGHHRESSLEVDRLRALNAAEAGMARVIDDIWLRYRKAHEEERVALVDALDGKFGKSMAVRHKGVKFSTGEYDVRVVRVIRDGEDHADVWLTATGRCRNVERTVSAVMRYGRTTSEVFNYAYFINNYGWLWGAGIRVNGDVCSNGDFSVKNATVNGDILACLNPELGSLGTITGDSRKDSIEWYRDHTGDRARPTNPTCDLEGEDNNDNGIPDAYEYGTGFDGESEWKDTQEPVEMPYLGQLDLYKDLAARRNGSLRKGGSVIIDEVYEGTLVIEGTEAEPIEVDGPVVVTEDLIIKGVVKGRGSIYAGRNVHIAGDTRYETAPAWPKPSADPEIDAAKNEGADLVGFVARGSIIIGDYTQGGWKSVTAPYQKPKFTQEYEVLATDADIGYVTHYKDGRPMFHADYTAKDGGKKQDGSDRRYYESSLSDADFTAFADIQVQRVDGILYTNHLFSGKIGVGEFNGTIVSRDEAIIYSGSIDISYDVRVHSDGYEAIDIYLPRSPMRKLLLWRDGGPQVTSPMEEEEGEIVLD